MAFVFAGAFVTAFAGTGAFALAISIAVAFAGVRAGAGGMVYAFSVIVAFAGASVFTDVVALACAAGVPITRELMAQRDLKGLFYILFLPVMLGLLAVAISNPGWFHFNNKILQYMLIFLVFLPLTNSIFDWLSLAATRALLNGMAERDDTPPPTSGVERTGWVIWACCCWRACRRRHSGTADDEPPFARPWRTGVFRSGRLAAPAARQSSRSRRLVRSISRSSPPCCQPSFTPPSPPPAS